MNTFPKLIVLADPGSTLQDSSDNNTSRRENICPRGFTACPPGALRCTSGGVDRCQGASKNQASFDALSHCLARPRNILFLASGANMHTREIVQSRDCGRGARKRMEEMPSCFLAEIKCILFDYLCQSKNEDKTTPSPPLQFINLNKWPQSTCTGPKIYSMFHWS